VAYGFFNYGAVGTDPSSLLSPFQFSITKCLKTENDIYWLFAVNPLLSLVATIREGGAFELRRGKDAFRGVFTSVERRWDPEFRDCFVCESVYPPLCWVVGINAFDTERKTEVYHSPGGKPTWEATA
jgi:hypothetical protein